MTKWNEIHTAAQVARLGTVSAAAKQLGIHRATVIRHIEQLEKQYGAKLFVRAKRGYTATDLGRELLRAADRADASFAEINRSISAQSERLRGELVITALALLVPDLLPIVERFTSDHPDMRVKIITGESLSRLEFGEADIAFRSGAKPNHPDHVVAPFLTRTIGLFASPAYIKRHGKPSGAADLAGHIFVSSTEEAHQKHAVLRWLSKKVDRSAIRFRFNDFEVAEKAIVAGLGIGFMPHNVARKHKGMTEVVPARKAWAAPCWRLTHVDLHRTPKVRAFLAALKAVGPA